MTEMWAVTLTYHLALDEAEYERLADGLDQLDASLFNLPAGRAMVTYWTDAHDPVDAAGIAREQIGNVIHQEPAGLEVVTADEHEERSKAPTLPRVVSAPEVAELLGNISRQRVHQLRSLDNFPAPLFELRTGPIWDARAIEKFGRGWARKPGRPAKAAG